jgi:hypothetical protein
MPDLYYTAITRQTADGYEIATETIGDKLYTYAEHFEDEGEAKKRARQFESQARQMDAEGETAHKVYTGTEPPEAFIVRLTWPAMTDSESRDEYYAKMDTAAAKAGAKTISVLGEPEHDDSQENRPVPPVAMARSAVEVAEQAVKDAQAAVDKHQGRADTLAEEALSRGPKSATPDIKAELRRKADGAQDEADQAKARLYHAEQELKSRQNAVAELEAQEA